VDARIGRATALVVTVLSVLVIWWLAYGRLTPFPSTWTLTPRSMELTQLVVAAALVSVAIALLTHLFSRHRLVPPVGALTWLVLSIWATRRGDGDGLWVLIVPFYVAIAIAMVALAALTRRVARRIRAGSIGLGRW
jgi:hypothetical protein